MTDSTSPSLENCEKEPIHIIGKIQDVGFFLTVKKAGFKIIQASKNVDQLLNISHLDLIGKSVADTKIDGLLEVMSTLHLSIDNIQPHPNTLILPNQKRYNLLIHSWKDNYIMEFEPQTMENTDYNMQYFLGAAMSKIHNSADVNSLLCQTAQEIKKTTGYDRVMIYKFHPDWHGEVVAESKEKHMEAYYGLHYPASDIPAQARKLFTANPVRFIHDVNSEPVELYPAIAEDETDYTDLSFSSLRSSSPMHIQYLKNMGVGASLTISLLINDKLWGMIACHHTSPKFVDFKLRQTCQFMGQLFSSALQLHLMDKENEELEKSRKIGSLLAGWTLKEYSIVEGLTAHKNKLNELIDCSGAAVCAENKICKLGKTPSEEEIQDLVEWLNENEVEDIFITDELSAKYPKASAYKESASGLIAARLSSGFGEYLLWFKGEALQTIYWGGNPDKAITMQGEGSAATVSPRQSFEKWAQIMKHKSEPWTNANISAVVKLREDVLQVIIKKANEIRKLHDQLEEAYKELDAFSYTVSHDLRTPLTAVKVYSEILLEEKAELFDDTAKDMVGKILKNADRMTDLIKAVLNYSKIGKIETSFTTVKVDELLPQVMDDLKTSYKDQIIEFKLGSLPDIYGDEIMVGQVFSNLLSNAVKYSKKKNKSIVEISGEDKAEEVIYVITDNGIGIDMQHIGKVFQIF
ncbi:histidine kinase dimerization/phospho-acceptor domain-containing protein [Fulvivirga maritima]|uniref:histidine kinase dimerization/phospho-acceptor domain-containing protein n=1 Tax=Fulvivirga maritima TaxID=2904247 RepID=UPI00210817F8|nr:histidine kinase dimerization/phospho-acceptor domain-containing protein [Fulvivirga maritima]